jgi:hypothetical protein
MNRIGQDQEGILHPVNFVDPVQNSVAKGMSCGGKACFEQEETEVTEPVPSVG